MNAQEFELVLNDLETRVDRLRALYENWFRGYEKIEPQVARKDVERRVYAMRKELPRNTALRFRYHQLYQRYTTLANYWQRTARQIEEGTYRLQIARMRRRAEQDAPQRRRLLRRERESDGPSSYELDLDESLSIDDLLSDFEMDEVARAVEIPGAHSEPPRRPSPLPRAPMPAAAPFAREAFADSSPPTLPPGSTAEPLPPIPPPARVPVAPASTGIKVALVPGAPAQARTVAEAAGAQAGVLPATGTMKGGLPASARASSAMARAETPTTGSLSSPNRAAPLPQDSAGEAPTGTLPGLDRPVPGPQASTGTVAGMNRPTPGPQASTGTLPGLNRPPPVAALEAVGGAPTGTLPGLKRPAPAPVELGVSGAKPVAARAAAFAQPSGGTQVGRPPPPPNQTSAGAVPSEQRLRRLYDEYAAARRRNNEAEVRFDALVTSIQKMLPELQKKHQGKQIDFEVVVKDGRVGLKPKAI